MNNREPSNDRQEVYDEPAAVVRSVADGYEMFIIA